tara:strand:+ start:1758 stop:2636 length:879 start_codon:yes stop_codon:yes gene_type:complete
MTFEGFFINLERSKDRRKIINQNLKYLGLENKIFRFKAYETKNADNWQVCKSKGEYGLWMSILNCLNVIKSKKSTEKHFLIMEDDFCFNKDSLKRLNSLKKILESKEKNLDILFLDYLIDIPLFECICLEKKKSIENFSSEEIFYDSKYFYYASTSSFLVKKSSAIKIYKLLVDLFNKGIKSGELIPIDMALRLIIRSNLINSKIVIPPLGTSDWFQDQSSLIQNDSSDLNLRKAHRAYLLIRCLVSNNYSIDFCLREFSKLIEEDIDINKYQNLYDFYTLFKEKSHKFMIF